MSIRRAHSEAPIRLAIEAVRVLKDNGVPLKLNGETRFGEPVVDGIIGPVIDSSIDELISSKDVVVNGRAAAGPAAKTVLVFETPAAALPLERRIDAHAALIRRLLARIADSAPAPAHAPSPSEYGIRLQEAWITLPDGVRLSADLYMPDGRHGRREISGPARVPALSQERGRAAAITRCIPISCSAATWSRRSISAAPATAKAG